MSSSSLIRLAGLALLAFLGTVLLAGAFCCVLFVHPALTAEAPGLLEAELGLAGFILTSPLAAVGWVLFGVATLRAGLYPRWAAILLIVGGAIAFFPLPLRGIIFFVSVAYLGFLLFTGQVGSDEQPSRVS